MGTEKLKKAAAGPSVGWEPPAKRKEHSEIQDCLACQQEGPWVPGEP